MEALREGNVTANALDLAFFKEDLRELFQGAAHQLGRGVLAAAKESHLLRRGLSLAHDLSLELVVNPDAEVVRQQLRLGDRQFVQVGVDLEPLCRGGVGVEAMLDEHIERSANSSGPAKDTVIFAARAVLSGGGAARLFGAHELADLLRDLQGEAVHAVLVVVGPVDNRVRCV